MSVNEIRAYLSHLAVAKNVAASTQNIALSALLFLYKQMLKIDLPYIDQIERAKKPKRLPVVYSRAEAKAILANLEGTTYLIVGLLHGCGLRLTECLSLRVKDPDFEYRQITIRDGKGAQDRITMMPSSLVELLKLQTHKTHANRSSSNR
jgi:integrase